MAAIPGVVCGCRVVGGNSGCLNLRASIYIERQGGREIESPLVMELLSKNDSSFAGFHLLFSIIWKLEWRPSPSFVSKGKMVFGPTAEVSSPTSCMYLKKDSLQNSIAFITRGLLM